MNTRLTSTTTWLAAPALALALLAGCTAQSDAPITGRAERYDESWLTLGSKQLRADTMIGQPRQVRDESGILRVVLPVRCTTDYQLYIDYRVTFFDAQGLEVNAVTGNVTIPARQLRNINANSTSPRAETFHVDLHYPRVN